jgi:hypothetical protein
MVIFSSYSLITNPLWALPIEVLNGMSYALSISAVISYAAHVSPVGAEGTLQGVVGMALTGIGSRFVVYEKNDNNNNKYLTDLMRLYGGNNKFNCLQGCPSEVLLVDICLKRLEVLLRLKT